MRNRSSRLAVSAVTLMIGTLIGFGCSESARQGDGNAGADEAPEADTEPETAGKIQRFGSVIGLKHEKMDYYNELHANPWPEINAMIKKCNIQNYSIYEVELEGKLYLFSYCEYTGDDFDADMQMMKDDPKTNEWWAETDPCQIKLPGTPEGDQWLGIEEVFHLD